MQQQNWNKNYTKSQLERVQLKDTLKLVMPKDILHKIKFLCKSIPKVEWSGILLYTVKGSIKNPKNMEILLKDIIPMQKGSSAYTEYNYNEKKRDTSGYEDRMIDYFNDNPEAFEQDWKVAHIHSHNVMQVFFSGTDMGELEDNSVSHDFYLSLIVNNWMDFKAKVAFRATANAVIPVEYQASDENGKSYKIEDVKIKVKKEKLFIYDCEIVSPEEKITIDETFKNSVAEIIEKANRPVATNYTSYNNNYGYGGNAWANGGGYVVGADPYRKQVTPTAAYQKPVNYAKQEVSKTDEFIIALLRGTNPPDEQISTIELALDELDTFSKTFTPEELANNVVENYSALFEKYFEGETEDGKKFTYITAEVIETLEEYEDEYSFLFEVNMALRFMLHKYENYARTV